MDRACPYFLQRSDCVVEQTSISAVFNGKIVCLNTKSFRSQPRAKVNLSLCGRWGFNRTAKPRFIHWGRILAKCDFVSSCLEWMAGRQAGSECQFQGILGLLLVSESLPPPHTLRFVIILPSTSTVSGFWSTLVWQWQFCCPFEKLKRLHRTVKAIRYCFFAPR